MAVAVAALVRTSAAAEDVRGELSGDEVTIIAGSDRTVYEYRQNGTLRMVRVVPAFGRPYYLVPADPTRAFGDVEAGDGVVAQWRIVEF